MKKGDLILMIREVLLIDDEYHLLTSLSKDDFNELVGIISSASIRNSSNRSIRTAVGIYLCELILGYQPSLSYMFQFPDKRTVSKTVNGARQTILKNFVPYNLGFKHVTRQDVIDYHTTTIARQLMCDGDGSNTAIVVIDGTYIYIQMRNNFPSVKSGFLILRFRNLEIKNSNEKHSIYIRKDLY